MAPSIRNLTSSALTELVHRLNKHSGVFRVHFRGDAMAEIENMAGVITEILQNAFHFSTNGRR